MQAICVLVLVALVSSAPISLQPEHDLHNIKFELPSNFQNAVSLRDILAEHDSVTADAGWNVVSMIESKQYGNGGYVTDSGGNPANVQEYNVGSQYDSAYEPSNPRYIQPATAAPPTLRPSTTVVSFEAAETRDTAKVNRGDHTNRFLTIKNSLTIRMLAGNWSGAPALPVPPTSAVFYPKTLSAGSPLQLLESAAYPGYYLIHDQGVLRLSPQPVSPPANFNAWLAQAVWLFPSYDPPALPGRRYFSIVGFNLVNNVLRAAFKLTTNGQNIIPVVLPTTPTSAPPAWTELFHLFAARTPAGVNVAPPAAVRP